MIQEFADITGLSTKEILGNSHRPQVVDARHIYWLLLLKSGYSYTEIAQLNSRVYSSIYLAIRKIENLLSIKDFESTNLYNRTKHLIRSKMSTINSNITLIRPNLYNSEGKAVEDFTFRGFDCPRCQGLGYIYIGSYHNEEDKDSTCPICLGHKKIKAIVHIEWSADSD